MLMVCGGGGKFLLRLEVRERTATSVSPGGDASPEDSGEDNDIAVSSRYEKFRMVIVWCLVLCILRDNLMSQIGI